MATSLQPETLVGENRLAPVMQDTNLLTHPRLADIFVHSAMS
jgi:hypothetical protein